jgi:hypothetical protein
LHFGYPYCHGGTIPDPKFGAKHPCSEFTLPVQNLDPHVAALGMRFYTGTMFPAAYHRHVFIAEHGSWNRTVPIGYRVTLVRLENNRAVSYEPFAEGWLLGGRAWGRPVDVLVMPDVTRAERREAMEYRPLGRTGLQVSRLGFGCGNVGGLIIRGAHQDRVQAVARAMEAGIN